MARVRIFVVVAMVGIGRLEWDGRRSSRPGLPQGVENSQTHGPDGLDLDAHASWNASQWTGVAPTSDVADDTRLHEMGHNLGAIQKVAPMRSPGRTATTAPRTSCCTSATSNDTGGPDFDYGKDDYWDPATGKLAWWTVNLSKYLCPTETNCAAAATPSY
jgi:hypothetical protein